MKAIIKDRKVYRMRRGKLVEIPEQWVGKHTTKKTIRQRRSKQLKKRRDVKPGSYATKEWIERGALIGEGS